MLGILTRIEASNYEDLKPLIHRPQMAGYTTLAEALVLRSGLFLQHSQRPKTNPSGGPQAMPGPWQGLRSRANQGPDQPMSTDLLTTQCRL